MVIIYAFKIFIFLSGWWQTWRTVVKKKDVLAVEFLPLLRQLLCVVSPFPSTRGSSDLIAPSDIWQAGSQDMKCSVLPTHGPSMQRGQHRCYTVAYPTLAHTTVKSPFAVPEHVFFMFCLQSKRQNHIKNTACFQACAQTHSFIHPCSFSKGVGGA